MRTSILALCFVFLAGSPVLASVVVYDGTPGIVAVWGEWSLDSNGHVWQLSAEPSEWQRRASYDPPMPVEEMLFWERETLITIYNEAWFYYIGAWQSTGTWPDLPSSIEGESDPLPGAAVFPNPSPGACSVSFRVPSEGEISATVLDVSGRIVRHLLDGSHPAGEYRLEWDGTDENGRELPAGVYLTRIETIDGETIRRVILAR